MVTQLGGVAENIDFLNTNKGDLAVLDTLDQIDFELFVDPTASRLEIFVNNTMQVGETVDDYASRLIINAASNIGAHVSCSGLSLFVYFVLRLNTVA